MNKISSDTEVQRLSVEDCEALYLRQVSAETLSDSRKISKLEFGMGKMLPVSEATWSDFYNSTMPVKQEPWWIHIDSDNDSARALLLVDCTLDYFVGHFPGQPLLPGVVQIYWVQSLVQELFSDCIKQKFSGASQLKFKSPVLPGSMLSLDLKRCVDKIEFGFYAGQLAHTQGTLFYRG